MSKSKKAVLAFMLGVLGVVALSGALRVFVSVNGSWSLPEWGWFRVPVLLLDGDFKRGDKVEFTSTLEGGATSSKVIMGLAGDVIRTDAGRNIWVGGRYIGTAKAETRTGRPLAMISAGVIPEGHYFMAGVHADSYDSRYQEIGLIAHTRITARLWALPDVPMLGLDGTFFTREAFLEEEEQKGGGL